LVELTDTDLHEHVRGLELERRTLDARFAAAVAVADVRQLNAVVDGHRSMGSYLRAELNYSTGEASRWLQVATMVNAHPTVGDAWINGHIGSAQVVTFARTHTNRRVRDRLGEFVPTLLDHAEQLPHSDFSACVDKFVTLADTDGAHDDRDHAVVGHAAGTILNIITDAHTFAHTQRDAGLAPSTTLDGEPVDPFTGLPDPYGLIGDLLGAPGDLADRRCETSTGIQLHPHDVLRAALAGHVRRVVIDTDGVIVNMGRLSRLYTGSARTAAKLLIRRCQRPGCELPADFSQVDHNNEWNEHGHTDQANAGVMCGADNRQKHRQRWKRKRATNGNTYTIRADGTIMLPVGARTPKFLSNEEDLQPIGSDHPIRDRASS
jgi:Domain of unknown function (DUF222)